MSLFFTPNGINDKHSPLNPTLTYPSTISFDEYATAPNNVKTRDMFFIPFTAELMENEESYNSFKQLIFFSNSLNTLTLGLNQKAALPTSYISILNNFRGDYEDFNW